MSLVLAKAVDADFDRLMEIQFEAFGQTGDAPREPFIDVMFPGGDTPSGQAAARDLTLKWLRSDPSATFLKVTDTITGEILGGAKWCVYMEKPERWQKRVQVEGEGDETEYIEFALGTLYRNRFEKTAAKGPFLFLDIIFVDPKHQRRGAGSKLVKWGVDRADEMGVEAFLEATRFGRHMYEQHGFQVTEDIVYEVPEKWAHKPKIQHFFMWRPAVKTII